MAYGESNGHVTDDVTWPWKDKLVSPICLSPMSQKWLEIAKLLRTTNKKQSMENRMITHVNNNVTW